MKKCFPGLFLVMGLVFYLGPADGAAGYSYVTYSPGDGYFFPFLLRFSPRVSTSWADYGNGDSHRDSRAGLEMGITPLNLVGSRVTCEFSISVDPYMMTSTTPDFTGFSPVGYNMQLIPALQFFPGKRSVIGLAGILGLVQREDFPAQPSLYRGSFRQLTYFSGGGGLVYSFFLGEEMGQGVLSARVFYTRLLMVGNTSYYVIDFQEEGTGLEVLQEAAVTLGYSLPIY